jgi:hypothetical protein
MPQFNKAMMQQAYDIMNIKSTYDDVKALSDIAQANTTLNELKNCGIFYSSVRVTAQMLDARLRNDYPEIIELQQCVNALSRITLHPQNAPSSKPPEVYALHMDICGICASVLIKHHIISCIKDTLTDDSSATYLYGLETQEPTNILLSYCIGDNH